MLEWYNFTDGRSFSFVSSTLPPNMIRSLVDDGFYYMGEPGFVHCCGCKTRVMISHDTKESHRLLEPLCYLVNLSVCLNGTEMSAKIGVTDADPEIKQALSIYITINQTCKRLNTFDVGTNTLTSP